MISSMPLLMESTVLGFFTWWVVFFIGLVIGWSWRPRWASSDRRTKLCCLVSKSLDISFPSSPSGSTSSPLKGYGSAPCLKALAQDTWNTPITRHDTESPSALASSYDQSKPEKISEKSSNIVTQEDLQQLVQLVESKDGGPAWMQMMDRFMPTMRYKAQWREPKTGPTEYRSSTIFEDSTPELVRDFFWDDEFRPRWDTMLARSTIIEECLNTGTMVVKWIRKFPFFCSDREYIIGRRIWNCGRTFYCVTKGISHPSIPRCNKPRRVDLYYSSWCIRAVESSRGDGQTSACEVLLFHHEDMGIPREIAKLGVRQGMWGAVKKIEPGLCVYQKQRLAGAALSRSAYMAQINTRITLEYLNSIKTTDNNVAETQSSSLAGEEHGGNLTKVLILGGAVLMAFSLQRGMLPKALILGAGRRFANIGRRR